MVFIIDEGSEFDAPLDKVWKLNQAHITDATKIHTNGKNRKSEMINENTAITSWESDMQGQTVKTKMKLSIYSPIGLAIEVLEGPMAGSKFFNYYTPKGNKTGVTVVGDFKSPGMSDDQIRQTVFAFLEQAFNEDNTHIKTMP